MKKLSDEEMEVVVGGIGVGVAPPSAPRYWTHDQWLRMHEAALKGVAHLMTPPPGSPPPGTPPPPPPPRTLPPKI